jgi:hypothetical protein
MQARWLSFYFLRWDHQTSYTEKITEAINYHNSPSHVRNQRKPKIA